MTRTALPEVPWSRRDIRLLDAVADSHLNEAARRLRVRSGAIERHLERLDRTAGVPLTLRTPASANLTSFGERVLAAGRRFYVQVDRALGASLYGEGDADESPRILAVATSDPALEELIEDLAAEPGLFLALSHGSPDQVVRQLDAYRVDVAHTSWLSDPRSGIDRAVRVHRALDEPLWVWLPSDHPLAGLTVVSLADLADDRWVSEVGPDSEPVVAAVHRATGLPVPADVEVTISSVARGLLGRGDVVALGSPLAPPLTTGATVRRRLVEGPARTTGLIVDPSVPAHVADHLAGSMAAHYLATVQRRHAPLLDDPWWASWHASRSADPGVRELVGWSATDDPWAGASGASPVGIPQPRAGSPMPPAAEAPPPDAEQQLDVQELHMLRAIAEHGSINRAASAMSISQPALTRRMHRLESRLGAQLLLRTSRGTTLTGPVRQFLDHLTLLEREFHETASVGSAIRRGAVSCAAPHRAATVARHRPVSVTADRTRAHPRRTA